LGANPHKRFAAPISSLLEDFLRHPNPSFRSAGVASYLSQVKLLDEEKIESTVWTVLPLYADIDHTVRYSFHRFIKNIPYYHEVAIKRLSPHVQDEANLRYW
jgi:hypothetical protein